MDVLLALLAAVAFAFGNVLQQKGTLEAPASGDDPRFLAQIVRRPVWLAGGILQASGWVLQAAALDRGPLLVVQSITTLSLVLSLPLGAKLTGQQIGRREISGAVCVTFGIIVFLSVGAPSGGTTSPSAEAWLSAGFVSTLLIVGLAGMGFRRQGAARALFLGSAAGFAYAMQAAVTKVFVTELGNGLGAVLSDWPVYVLVVSALVGFALQQSALKTGVLAPAIASSNSVTLFASVLLGITVFDENLAHGDGRAIPAIVGLGIALFGVGLLASARPPDEAAVPTEVEGSSTG
jgi:hypothetical protein